MHILYLGSILKIRFTKYLQTKLILITFPEKLLYMWSLHVKKHLKKYLRDKNILEIANDIIFDL